MSEEEGEKLEEKEKMYHDVGEHLEKRLRSCKDLTHEGQLNKGTKQMNSALLQKNTVRENGLVSPNHTGAERVPNKQESKLNLETRRKQADSYL